MFLSIYEKAPLTFNTHTLFNLSMQHLRHMNQTVAPIVWELQIKISHIYTASMDGRAKRVHKNKFNNFNHKCTDFSGRRKNGPVCFCCCYAYCLLLWVDFQYFVFLFFAAKDRQQKFNWKLFQQSNVAQKYARWFCLNFFVFRISILCALNRKNFVCMLFRFLLQFGVFFMTWPMSNFDLCRVVVVSWISCMHWSIKKESF